MLSSAPLKVAVTGGSGFLGSHLLPHLQDAGYTLSCLSRSPAKIKKFPSGAQIVPGDCLDAASLKNFLAGQDVLIHMASVLFAPSWQSYLEANSQASQNIIAAMNALKAEDRPSKVIFISSLAAAGPCAKSPGLDESAQPSPVSAYGWSKLLSERIFQAALGERLLILRPPIIYGSGDLGLLPMFKSAARGLGISPGAFRDFPVSIIHAEDMARAIVLLLQRQASGLYHINDGQEHSMASICEAMGKALGKRVRVARMPLAIMGATALAASATVNLVQKTASLLKLPLPKTPQWNLDKFREAKQAGWLVNARRISLEQQFKPSIDLASGMEEAVTAYRKLGLL